MGKPKNKNKIDHLKNEILIDEQINKIENILEKKNNIMSTNKKTKKEKKNNFIVKDIEDEIKKIIPSIQHNNEINLSDDEEKIDQFLPIEMKINEESKISLDISDKEQKEKDKEAEKILKYIEENEPVSLKKETADLLNYIEKKQNNYAYYPNIPQNLTPKMMDFMKKHYGTIIFPKKEEMFQDNEKELEEEEELCEKYKKKKQYLKNL